MRFMRPVILTTALCAMLVGLLGAPAQADTTTTPPAGFPLPAGFQPEGIAIGPGPVAFFGSRATGAIYRADLRTGRGSVLSDGPGTPSLGLKTDATGRLFVAGGTGGDARVIDTRTGRLLKSYSLASGAAFVNDVVLARKAAWFTDSTNPVLYRLRLGAGGTLPATADTVPLTGAIEYGPGINANGIAETPDGRSLLIVQSNTGRLFKADPVTGVTTSVDLGGESLGNGDGLLLVGRTLYVVQNRLNVVTAVRMSRDGSSGRVVDRLTDQRFDVPTTVARFGDRLYLPNARFTTPPEPNTPYDVVGIRAARAR